MSKKKETSSENITSASQPVPIVAIGASAGGLEAFSELLNHLSPRLGLAYVYIQHLSPTYESQLVAILSRATSMKVKEADHLMPIEPDNVYVIPANKDMEVIDGVLTLLPRKSKPDLHMPIDQFFVSLAKRQKDGAIGIVLSGMATDGTLGLKAIKVAGGVALAQDDSANFQSMPHSAIAEGVIDMVLSPQEMAAVLERLSKRADVFQLTNENREAGEEPSSDEDLDKILAYLRSAVGVDFEHYKRSTIRRRVIRRMLLYKLETLKEYIAYLRQHTSEAGILYADLLINVTCFFRDSETMAYLKKDLFPKLIKSKSAGEAIRIWIPACSTGQEAYSLGMILMEIMGTRATSHSVQIFATDLSETAINKARLGVYTKSEVLDVSSRRLQRFFTKVDDSYRINKVIRDMCVFAPHNLLKDPPFSRIDLLSCRNLLIYLDSVLQQKALTTFHYALNSDGFLLLGKSESVGSSASQFFQVEKTHKLFQRKNTAQSRIPFEMKPKWANTSAHRQDFSIKVMDNSESVSSQDLDKLVDNLLLSKYVPASVVVDRDLEIIQFRGSTGLFLEPSPGKPSFSLSKMARPPLLFELRNIIHKAKKSGKPASKRGLDVKVQDKLHYIDIEAVPITYSSNQQLFLILFKEMKENMPTDPKKVSARDQRIQELEAELSALREDMHSIIEEQEASNEELQSANEEIVSSNEELQSINEELETSKEEIESTNEELLTINQELQTRNDQLTEAYGYSEAILSTISEATLILDKNFRIKGANEAFYNVFRITSQEVEGKVLFETGNYQWNFPGLRHLLENVIIRNEVIKGFEVSFDLGESNKRTMLLHARQVVQHERLPAILIVMEDITEHRNVQKLLQERQQWFEELVDNAPALIWVTQANGTVSYLNRAWLDFTGEKFEKGNSSIPSERMSQDDLEAYIKASVLKRKERKPYTAEYRLQRRDGEYRWIMENAKPMFSADGQFTGYIGTCTDVHLQKNLTQQLNEHVDQKTQELRESNKELAGANQILKQTADRLQSVLNGVPAAVTLMEAIVEQKSGKVLDFNITVFNEHALKMTELTTEDIKTRTLLESIPNLKETGLFDLYVEVFESGASAYQEVTGLLASGPDTLAILITRQVDKNGIVITALDISKRKQAELQLIETADSLQAILDGSPASIGFFKAVFDEGKEVKDFVLIVYNSKFVQNFNLSPVDSSGLLASQLFSEEQLRVMKGVFTSNSSHYEEQYLERDKKWLGESLSRHDHGVVITQLDITLLKKADQEQNKLIQQLEGSAEMLHSLKVMKQHIKERGEFLRATSHDLRSSFGIIIGAATLLNMMDSEEERVRTLEMIHRNLRNVTQMMNQLLDYSRLEAGQEQVELSHFDVSYMLSELCENSRPLAADKGLSLDFDGPSSLPIEGDEVKVRRIAQNLILNALKYTTQGRVKVSFDLMTQSVSQSSPSTWFLSVQDTGVGLSTSVLEKLIDSDDTFNEALENKEPDPTSLAGGEGIGLKIVKGLCELLEARLEVESTSAGTSFLIVFPRSYN